MYIAASTMQGAPLRCRQSGKGSILLGYIRKLYIDPAKAQLVSVVVRRHRFWGATASLNAQNLDSVRGRLYLPGEQMCMSVDTIDNAAVRLEKAHVYTENGVLLGIIDDVYYDQVTFMVAQIEVARFMLFIPVLRLLISRQDIVDIRPGQVIVRDAVLEDGDLIPALIPKTSLANQPQQSRKS